MTPSFIRVAQRLLPASVRQHFADAIGRLNSEQRLDDKWLADSRALDIDERLRPLHRTIHSFAWSELRRFPNLTAPENFNDRIHWLMLFDQRELAIQCSDKKGVRDFVEERVGGEHLTELYACYDTAEKFEASSLPTRCAVKTSHDSGSVFLSTSQSPIQPVDILAEIRVALATQ
ncbi:MAG: ATP-grasp fold amidoligase family protein, partial [Planctomycetaceae bacterium]